MKIAIACGGTGGHVFPGLAVAEELTIRRHNVCLLCTGRKVENLALDGWTGEKVFTGPVDYSASTAIVKLFKLWGSRLLSIAVMRTLQPDVLLAMGGYASIGPVLAARKLGVPVVLHEGNAVPGRALRFLSRFADVTATNFKSTAELLKGREVECAGFPVRRTLIDAARKADTDSDSFNLLVIGGSQGAGFLNESMPAVINVLIKEGRRVNVMHVAGKHHKEAVKDSYRELSIAAEVYGFVNDMTEIYSKADAAIARAGASVCAELAAFGLPGLLIPYPFAADDHQTANADHYAEGGGAEVVRQSEFSVNCGVSFIRSLMNSPEKMKLMREGMLSCSVINAAAELADIIEKTGR